MPLMKELLNDVIFDILSRLPVKAIIRFRCVSKSWYATITHPSFITTHLNLNLNLNLNRNRTTSYNHGYLQYSMCDTCEESNWCVFSDQSYVNHVGFEIPLNCRHSYQLKLVGSVNGILCLVDYNFYLGCTFYLWNPSIGKFETLPSPSIVHSLPGCENPVTFGFGFHRQSNDYKVIRILYFLDNYSRNIYNAQCPPQVEVYTLSTDSWRKIEAIVPCYLYSKLWTAFDAFTNGSFHWIACGSVEAFHEDMIMSFDIGDEVFGEMKLPEYYYIHGTESAFLSLTSFEESLCLINFYWYPRNTHCWIWVMREYGVVESWTKQFTVVVPDLTLRPLCFTRNNELLLQASKSNMISCDLKSSQLKYHRTCWSDTSKVVPFMETLVFLDLENAENSQVEQYSFHGKRNSRLIRKLKEMWFFFDYQEMAISFIAYLLASIIYLLLNWGFLSFVHLFLTIKSRMIENTIV